MPARDEKSKTEFAAVTTSFHESSIVDDYSVYPLVHRFIGKPAFIEFIGDVNGKRIIDVGCGNGHMCHSLAQMGGDVVGLDLSAEFISRAKQSYPDLAFHVANGADMSMLPSADFDLALDSGRYFGRTLQAQFEH